MQVSIIEYVYLIFIYSYSMKKQAVTVLLAVCALSAAAQVRLTSAEITTPLPVVEASWGCQILLCLANPNGWRSVSYCVPPVTALIRHLRKKGRFPVCEQARANGSAQLVTRLYVLCPIGYREPQELGFPNPELAHLGSSLENEPSSKTCYGRYKGKKEVIDSETGQRSLVDDYDVVTVQPFSRFGGLAYEFFEGGKITGRLFIGSVL
jgi:hypothetical protein